LIAPELASNKAFVLSVILGGFWGMTFLNYLGLKTSSWFSTVGVIIGTIVPGTFIIYLGLQWWMTGQPVQIPLTADALLPSLKDLSSLVFLAGLFLAFAGLEVTAAYANQVKNPKKNYPRAILLGAVITFALFMLGSLAIAIVIPKEQISLVQGVMEAFRSFLSGYQLTWLVPIMALLMIIGAVAEINSWIIGPVRGLFATAYHGNLPPFFQQVNRKNVPTRLLFFQAVLVSIASLIFLYAPKISSGFWMLTALSAQSYLVMYILMFIAAIKLRYSKASNDRPYSVPGNRVGMWVLGLMGIVSSTFAILLSFVPPSALHTGNPYAYVSLLAGGLFVMCVLPLIIHRCRKNKWILKP
jgi:amino acid transporter